MNGRQQNKANRIRRRLLIIAIGCVLLLVFSFPAMLLISSTAGVIGGLAIICGFVVLQLPIFVLFKKAGWLPNVDRKDPGDEDQESKRTLHF